MVIVPLIAFTPTVGAVMQMAPKVVVPHYIEVYIQLLLTDGTGGEPSYQLLGNAHKTVVWFKTQL